MFPVQIVFAVEKIIRTPVGKGNGDLTSDWKILSAFSWKNVAWQRPGGPGCWPNRMEVTLASGENTGEKYREAGNALELAIPVFAI